MSIPNQRDPDLVQAIIRLQADLDELKSSVVGRWGRGPQGLLAQRPSATAALNGTTYYASDVFTLYQCDGTGWAIIDEPVQSWNPTVAATGGTITTVGAKSFSYRRGDGWLTWHMAINITTNGTGSGAVTVTMPVASNQSFVGSGREMFVTGKALSCVATASTMYVFDYSNAYPAGDGYLLAATGRYQMITRYS